MLRLIFVLTIIVFGSIASLYSPFNALLFYLWNAYFRPDDWTYGSFIASLNLSFVIGAFLLVATPFSRPQVRRSLVIALIALFFVDTLVCTFRSEHQSWSWTAWIEFAKVMIISNLIVVLTTDRKRYRLVLLTIAMSLGFECAKQGWAQLFIAPGAQNNNTIVFLGDNNGVAVGTMMLVPILSALAQTAHAKFERFIHRFVLIGVFMRGITTYSRGGFLAAAVLGLFSVIRSPRKFRALLAIALLAFVVSWVMPQRYWDRISTINASDDQRDDSAAGRLHFWKVAQIMAAANPVTGVGFNGFSQSYEAYNGPAASAEFSGERAAHSMWFGTMADLGYPGLLLFVSILALSVWSCWRVSLTCKNEPKHLEIRIYANALMTSLLTFAVGGTFLSSQYNEMYWHLVALSATLPFLLNTADVVTDVVPAIAQTVSGRPIDRPATVVMIRLSSERRADTLTLNNRY